MNTLLFDAVVNMLLVAMVDVAAVLFIMLATVLLFTVVNEVLLVAVVVEIFLVALAVVEAV